MGRLYIHKASANLITLGQIPGVLKGYPYCMQQAVKVTVLVLLVSLLSGCSGSKEVKPIKSEREIFLECESAKDDKRFYDEKIEEDLKKQTIISFDNYDKTGSYDSPETKFLSEQIEVSRNNINSIIKNNPSCFGQ